MMLHWKRFTRPQVLQRLGRDLLARFFLQFQGELERAGLTLPAADLPDAQYFDQVVRLVGAPEALPDALTEALFAVHELAGVDGQERLEQTAVALGLELRPGSSREDIALQIWLANPAALARAHNLQRLRRLSTFEYFGTSLPAAQRPPLPVLGEETLLALQARLDPWFAQHQRGENATRLQLYTVPSPTGQSLPEYWFLIRHGDTFSRTPKVEAQKTEILHFRPERDDVVVYSPQHDEIRVNARTRGERELYVRCFGLCLRGSEEYFSWWSTYTLEPLREEGADALDVAGVDGIQKIVLREIELAWPNPREGRTVRQGADLFAPAAEGESLDDLLPRPARLARAGFDVVFPCSTKARPVEIRLPNVLKVGRHCDARALDEWLCRRGFRRNCR